jgi:hypothetical protein
VVEGEQQSKAFAEKNVREAAIEKNINVAGNSRRVDKIRNNIINAIS